jgi:hypothetical protein
MYAWCVSVHKNKVQLVHALPPNSTLISQPPHNWELGKAAMLHYTWGTLFFKDDKEVWRFEKRDWTAKEHERKVSILAHFGARCNTDTPSADSFHALQH